MGSDGGRARSSVSGSRAGGRYDLRHPWDVVCVLWDRGVALSALIMAELLI